MLREHEHADLGKLLAQRHRRLEPVVLAAGRHLDVDDRDVRAMRERLAQEVVGVAGARHDVHARVVEHSRDAFAQQHVVLADHDPQRLTPDPTVLL